MPIVQDMLDSIIATHELAHLKIRRIYIRGYLYDMLCRELMPAQNAKRADPSVPLVPRPSAYKGYILYRADDISFRGPLRQVSIAVEYEHDF